MADNNYVIMNLDEQNEELKERLTEALFKNYGSKAVERFCLPDTQAKLTQLGFGQYAYTINGEIGWPDKESKITIGKLNEFIDEIELNHKRKFSR